MSKYILIQPEALGYIASDIANPEFQFSLEGVEPETIQNYLDNNIIAYGND